MMSSSEWKTYIFSDFVTINPPVKLDSAKEYSFVEMKDLNENNKFVYPSVKRKLSGGSRFQNNDTLFARITPCLENGKICQVKNLDGNVGFGSTEFLIFRGKEGISDNDFVYYLSRSDVVRRYAEQNMLGTSGRQRVPRETFDNLEFEFPPLPAQRRIADILSALDEKIELNRQVNATLERIAQAIFKEWFVVLNYDLNDSMKTMIAANHSPSNNQINQSADSALPQGWRVGKLGEICKNVRNTVQPKDVTATAYVGLEHIPRKSLGLISWGTSDDVGSQKTRFNKYDILFGKLRPYFHKVCIAPVEGICSTDILVIEPLEDYIFSFCLNYLFSNELITYVSSIADGTRMPRVDWNSINNYEIIIPPENLLIQFNNITFPLYEKIIENNQQSATLAALRDALLPKLMGGEIEV
jgi:type I restriction enzyme S subunit